MVFFYKSYPYAPSMTLCSALTMLGTILCVCFGIVLIINLSVLSVIGVLIAALGAFLYFYVYRKIIPEKAEDITKKNIETKVGFALQYCRANPQDYEAIAAVNQEFAAKYERNEDGKIIKRK